MNASGILLMARRTTLATYRGTNYLCAVFALAWCLSAEAGTIPATESSGSLTLPMGRSQYALGWLAEFPGQS